MFQRIGFFFIGAAAIAQAKSLFAGEASFSDIFTRIILHPVDFLAVSLLFLIGFLMFSSFFYHFINLLHLTFKRKVKIQGKDFIELSIFVVLFLFLFRFGFWLALYSCIFAFLFGSFSAIFLDEKEVYPNERG